MRHTSLSVVALSELSLESSSDISESSFVSSNKSLYELLSTDLEEYCKYVSSNQRECFDVHHSHILPFCLPCSLSYEYTLLRILVNFRLHFSDKSFFLLLLKSYYAIVCMHTPIYVFLYMLVWLFRDFEYMLTSLRTLKARSTCLLVDSWVTLDFNRFSSLGMGMISQM